MENGPLTSKTYQPGKTNNFCILNGYQLCRNFLSATHLTNAHKLKQQIELPLAKREDIYGWEREWEKGHLDFFFKNKENTDKNL